MSVELESQSQPIYYENDLAAAWHAQANVALAESRSREQTADVVELVGREAIIAAEETTLALFTSQRIA